MYHIVVQQQTSGMELPEIEESDNDYLAVFKQPVDAECVEFSVGNPRVEHITGIVHLYKRTVATALSDVAQNSTAEVCLCQRGIQRDMHNVVRP